MKLLNSNNIVPIIGIASIAIFSALFYLDITRRISAGKTEKIGTVTFKRKIAQRKFASQVVWQEIEQNADVYNYDTIRTENLSEAVFKLNDGTEITLEENSMIVLALTANEMDIQFKQGSIKANRDNVSNSDLKTLNIKSGDTNVSIDKSDISLRQDSGKKLDLTVKSGSANLNAGGKQELVKENQRIVAAAGDLRVYTIKFRLIAPSANAYLITPRDTKAVNFSWEPIREPGAIYIEISKNYSFPDLVAQRRVAGNNTTVLLQRGIYYWRLKQFNNATKKVDYSEIRRFSVLKDEPLLLVAPRNGAIIPYQAKLPMIFFKWTESEIASSYRLIIAADREMKNIINNIQLTNTSAALDTLSKGTYYWKVIREVNFKEKAKSVSSPVFRLVVNQTNLVAPPKLVYPPDKKRFVRKALEKDAVAFSWKINQEIGKSKVVIAKDKNFANIAFQAESNSNYIRMNVPLESGNYYWRVTGIIDEANTTQPSEFREFNVVDTDTFALLAPEDKAVIAPKDFDETASVNFAWEKTSVRGNFQLELSGNRSFSPAAKTAAVSGFYYSMKNLDAGNYFWRVKLADEDGNVILESPVRSFLVKEKLGIPIALNPTNGTTVDMSKKNALEFSWRPLKGANLYKISLYQKKAGININIVEKETRTTILEMRELEKLDIGEFVWTLQAVEIQGRKILRKSPEVKHNFTISLGSGIEKPKIKAPKTLYIE